VESRGQVGGVVGGVVGDAVRLAGQGRAGDFLRQVGQPADEGQLGRFGQERDVAGPSVAGPNRSTGPRATPRAGLFGGRPATGRLFTRADKDPARLGLPQDIRAWAYCT